MRVIVMVKATKSSEAGEMPDQKMLSEMGKYNEELVNAGVMQAGEGLQPSSKGKRIRFSGGNKTVIDGPFTETKEVIGGFAIFEAPSMEAATELTKRFLRIHGDAWEIECEVRPLDGPEFGSESCGAPDFQTSATAGTGRSSA